MIRRRGCDERKAELFTGDDILCNTKSWQRDPCKYCKDIQQLSSWVTYFQ